MDQKISTGYQFKEHLPEHKAKLGDVWAVTRPDGQWLNYAPAQNVQQNRGVESEACTSFGSRDAEETLQNALFGDTRKWSARWLAYASGTTPTGNNPAAVMTAWQEKGIVLDTYWPNTADLTTWAAFYAIPPQSLYIKALEFIAEYNLQFRWIGTDVASIKAGLKISPIGVAGYAWSQDNNGLYYSPLGTQACHWFIIIGYYEDTTKPNGIVFVAFDSYEQNIKHLRGDYIFSEAMQYRLQKNVGSTPTELFSWERFLALIRQIFDI